MIIIKSNLPVPNTAVEITDDQWQCLKFIIEDGIAFHKAIFDDLKTDDQLMSELGINDVKNNFLKNKELFQKLTILGINTQNIENYEE